MVLVLKVALDRRPYRLGCWANLVEGPNRDWVRILRPWGRLLLEAVVVPRHRREPSRVGKEISILRKVERDVPMIPPNACCRLNCRLVRCFDNDGIRSVQSPGVPSLRVRPP